MAFICVLNCSYDVLVVVVNGKLCIVMYKKMKMTFVLIIYWFGKTFCVNGSVGDSESLHDVG